MQQLGMVNAKIIEHHYHSTTCTFSLESYEEALEVDSIVVLLEHLQMDEAALLADGPDHGDGGTPILQHVQLHTSCEPALRGLLSQIKGGLVHVHDLIIGALMNESSQKLHELKLLIL